MRGAASISPPTDGVTSYSLSLTLIGGGRRRWSPSVGRGNTRYMGCHPCPRGSGRFTYVHATMQRSAVDLRRELSASRTHFMELTVIPTVEALVWAASFPLSIDVHTPMADAEGLLRIYGNEPYSGFKMEPWVREHYRRRHPDYVDAIKGLGQREYPELPSRCRYRSSGSRRWW
ncbi:hypothetical protein QJS10_CPB04g01355 [Acorus calamus]|uniref:Uncharacterized protein n=1 Tax=Acorus calamus TaxID=4465 RepID=A0AAV9EWS7_ACOCL|nr:hypothetical protein QJS10_CPB04g01355 [Acorus calamus]